MRRLPRGECGPGIKRCEGPCGKELPKNSDWFDRDRSKEDGFKSWCKKCRAERREVQKLKEHAELFKALDAGVIANLCKAGPGGSLTPHQLEFYQYVTALLGGSQGAAMQWAANFIAAPPGSSIREKMLSNYQKLMISCSGDGKVSPPPELMSDEDLNAAIARDEERMRRNEERLKSEPPPLAGPPPPITDVP